VAITGALEEHGSHLFTLPPTQPKGIKYSVRSEVAVRKVQSRCHIATLFWYPNKNAVLGILKASHFSM
jgi:hypothetical protein